MLASGHQVMFSKPAGNFNAPLNQRRGMFAFVWSCELRIGFIPASATETANCAAYQKAPRWEMLSRSFSFSVPLRDDAVGL
ncbi:MAG: hypothetical protein DMF44_12500, partial [Verrucomicrobia bacterium]